MGETEEHLITLSWFLHVPRGIHYPTLEKSGAKIQQRVKTKVSIANLLITENQ